MRNDDFTLLFMKVCKGMAKQDQTSMQGEDEERMKVEVGTLEQLPKRLYRRQAEGYEKRHKR